MTVREKIERLSDILTTIINGSRGNKSVSIAERERPLADGKIDYTSEIRWSGVSIQMEQVKGESVDESEANTVTAMVKILKNEAAAIREKAAVEVKQAEALEEELKKLE